MVLHSQHQFLQWQQAPGRHHQHSSGHSQWRNNTGSPVHSFKSNAGGLSDKADKPDGRDVTQHCENRILLSARWYSSQRFYSHLSQDVGPTDVGRERDWRQAAWYLLQVWPPHSPLLLSLHKSTRWPSVVSGNKKYSHFFVFFGNPMFGQYFNISTLRQIKQRRRQELTRSQLQLSFKISNVSSWPSSRELFSKLILIFNFVIFRGSLFVFLSKKSFKEAVGVLFSLCYVTSFVRKYSCDLL